MSDFTHGFWSWYVAAISLVSILACALLLWLAGKARVPAGEAGRQDNTTGHVWDEDLREYNNPLPRWWMWLFILTVVFALGYLALFPGLGSFQGSQRWSQVADHDADVQRMRQALAPLYAEFTAKSVAELSKDPRALAMGERQFLNHCSQCHGSDGRGSKGFPNLTNGQAAWLGPLSGEHIVQTVTQGRLGMMPPMGVVPGMPYTMPPLGMGGAGTWAGISRKPSAAAAPPPAPAAPKAPVGQLADAMAWARQNPGAAAPPE